MALCYRRSMATTLRLNDDDQAVLDALVEEEGLSQNEVIRRAILDRAARSGHRARVQAGWSEIDAKYGELFERLKQV